MSNDLTTNAIALATLGAERRLKLNPTRQVQRIKRWAKERGWTIGRSFYHCNALHPTLKVDAIGLAIDAARKADAVIVVLDSAGKPTVLRVEKGSGD